MPLSLESMPPSQSDAIASTSRSYHTTCPPEEFRHIPWISDRVFEEPAPLLAAGSEQAQSRHGSTSFDSATVNDPARSPEISSKFAELDVDSIRNSIISRSSNGDFELPSKPADIFQRLDSQSAESSASLISEYSRARLLPSYSSSFLRPSSKFRGEQISNPKDPEPRRRNTYNVQVELKHVDMSNSYLCGYLSITGLTADDTTLTTFFEGEMIGTKYGFLTRRPEWGSTDKKDLEHWGEFPATRTFFDKRQSRKASFSIKNFTSREHIFMRWKEQFLVPDHTDQNLNGASFAGFYYICFNQLTGNISGLYYHAADGKQKQTLELKHVPDMGCLPSIELR